MGSSGAPRPGPAYSYEDPRTGLTVWSLYGATPRPTEERLADVDVLVFDIQDIGARFYTYIWTMYYAMDAAAEYDKSFIVLDRPNPLGDRMNGPMLDADLSSFVGLIESLDASEGRAATMPFLWTGHSAIDEVGAYALADDLNSRDLPGVIFRPMFANPSTGKQAGKLAGGVTAGDGR